MSTKKIMILLGLIGFLGIGFSLSIPKPPPTPPQSTPPSPTPITNINGDDNLQTNVSYRVQAPTPIPTTLFRYTTKPYSTDEAYAFAANLGFPEPPKVSTAQNLDYFDWAKPQQALTINNPPLNLYYSSTPPATTNIPDLRTADSTAQAHLNQHFISSPFVLLPPSSQYLPPDQALTTDEGVAQPGGFSNLYYAYALEGIPLYRKTNLFSANYQVNADNVISMFNVSPPPSIIAQTIAQPIPYDQAVSRLKQNQGILVQSKPSFPTTDSEYIIDFSKAIITSASYVYVYLPEDNLILPAYKFSGTAPKTNSPKITYQISYLVPAI